MTWLTIVICLGARCEPVHLPLDAGPLACLTAQATVAQWLERERPGWRGSRGVGLGGRHEHSPGTQHAIR